jgi:hypothetical protein
VRPRFAPVSGAPGAAFTRPALRTFEVPDERLTRYQSALGLARRLDVDTSGAVDAGAVAEAVRRALREPA